LLTQDQRSPVDTLYAQVLILETLRNIDVPPKVWEAIRLLAEAFSEQWLLHLANPATLISPRVSRPQIDSIINARIPRPAKHLAGLFRAAAVATGLRLPATLLRWFDEFHENVDLRLVD
jgi:hypothetical protein